MESYRLEGQTFVIDDYDRKPAFSRTLLDARFSCSALPVMTGRAPAARSRSRPQTAAASAASVA